MINLLYIDDLELSIKYFESIFTDSINKFNLKTSLKVNKLWEVLGNNDWKINILVLDIEMDINGIDIAKSLLNIAPDIKVVFFSATSLSKNDFLKLNQIENVFGCFSKEIKPNILIESLEIISWGGKVLNYELVFQPQEITSTLTEDIEEEEDGCEELNNFIYSDLEIDLESNFDLKNYLESDLKNDFDLESDFNIPLETTFTVEQIKVKNPSSFWKNKYIRLFIIGLAITQILQLILLLIILLFK